MEMIPSLLAKSPGTHQEEGTIPQALLPLIAEGATRISDLISVARENDQWIYFCGAQPVFHHAENDHHSFRMFTAQLICQGACRQVDIVRAFGVSKQSVIRSVNKYRAGGVKAFYTPRATRGATVMTPEVTAQAEQLLGAGWSRREVAEHRIKPQLTSRPLPPTGPLGPSKMPRLRWARRAPGRTSASWRHSVFWMEPRPISSPAATSPLAACSAACRPWRRMACFDISTIALFSCAATTARCT